MPVAIQTYLYWGYADHYLRACHRRYGDAFTMRAFPAGTRVFLADPKDIRRVLTVPAEVAGHRLPAGTVVSPSIGLVQSADANFPDADAFAPERFLDAQAPPYSWSRSAGARAAAWELPLPP